MNIKLGRRIALLTLAVALSGCVTTQAPTSHVPASDTGNGVVVFSVTHDPAGGTRNNVLVYLNNGPLGGTNGHIYESSEKPLIGFVRDSDYPDVLGHLFVVTLPVGEHAFTTWGITNGSGLRIRPNDPPVFRFLVKPGTVTYLGAFHGNLVRGKNIFGLTITGDGFVSVSDQQTRDLPLLLKRYPQFAGQVAISSLPSGPWLNLRQGASSSVDPANPAPALK